MNLTKNAFKFTTKGFVTIKLWFDKTTKKLNCTISDSGQGLRKQDQIKIFKMFGKLQGNTNKGNISVGLGLSISQKIIQELHGDITVQS